MVNDSRGVALGQFFDRAGGVAGPDNFHGRMAGVGTELQLDVEGGPIRFSNWIVLAPARHGSILRQIHNPRGGFGWQCDSP